MKYLWLHLLILTSILAISRSEDAPADCVYSFYIQTGSILFSGTDSKITVTLSDASGKSVTIRNIEAWGGKMGPGHDYFEKGKLDILSGQARCLPGPVCSLKFTSDGSGSLPWWYVSYVDITTTGDRKACGQKRFNLKNWLIPPFSLSANNCRKASATEDAYFGLRSVVAVADD